MGNFLWARRLAVCLFSTIWIGAAGIAPAQIQTQPSAAQLAKLVVTVSDENGVAVPSARVLLQPSEAANGVLRCQTDFSGHCAFPNLAAGNYLLRVEKQDFYSATMPTVQVGVTTNVDITLAHQQEVREVVIRFLGRK